MKATLRKGFNSLLLLHDTNSISNQNLFNDIDIGIASHPQEYMSINLGKDRRLFSSL